MLKSDESSVIALKSGSKDINTTIASFFYCNSISSNVAHSSTHDRRDSESMIFAKHYPSQSYKAHSSNLKLLFGSGDLLDQAYKEQWSMRNVQP